MNNYCLLLVLVVILTACSFEEKEKRNAIAQTEVSMQEALISREWMDFNYHKAIAFATVNSFSINRSTDINVVDPMGDTVSVLLDSAQINMLRQITKGHNIDRNLHDTIEGAVADCFYPRHNIFFYDKKDRLINYILVCYECGRIKNSKNQPVGSLEEFKTFFNQIGLKVFDRPDFHQQHYDSLIIVRKKKNIRKRNSERN